MSNAVERAREFLREEGAFRLGELLTESFHPKTLRLSQTAEEDLAAAIRILQSVDEEIPPAMEKVFALDVFRELCEAFLTALLGGGRIFFTGCGSTGRLSILLEAAWRGFWREHPEIAGKTADLADSTISVMAGADFALIKAVEGFEDFSDFGRYQLRQAGVSRGDVVVAITEGGETPFVIGTAWEGVAAGAEVFFVYNNPTDLLRRHVERSREVVEEPRIKKLDLTTGPMAISGSTRMQATTAELLVVGAALEIALARFLRDRVPESDLGELGLEVRAGVYYHRLFVNLLNDLSKPTAVEAMVRAVKFEEGIYRQRGLVTYVTDSVLLDVLTDTTERSPTFMLPPFRPNDDHRSPRSWAFVKDPLRTTPEAWRRMLEREPRGLEWTAETYRNLGAPSVLAANPPGLDNSEIYKFQIGSEPDDSRTDAPDSALVAIKVGDDTAGPGGPGFEKMRSGFEKTAVISVGSAAGSRIDHAFEFSCELPGSGLRLWEHLAVKLILNTISTATMVRMSRVIGNAMVWLSPSNKKLIDRGSRLISQQTACTYEQACIELHKAIAEIESQQQHGQEAVSPVALAIERIDGGQDQS